MHLMCRITFTAIISRPLGILRRRDFAKIRQRLKKILMRYCHRHRVGVVVVPEEARHKLRKTTCSGR